MMAFAQCVRGIVHCYNKTVELTLFSFIFREKHNTYNGKEAATMKKVKVYDTLDCMRLIKKKYSWIPIFIVRRVLFAEELYMHKIGIIDWMPDLKSWHFKK